MGTRILHVAISDDWEASKNFGEYEVSTRGIGLFDAGYIRATTATDLDDVLQRRYADLYLPLVLLVIDVDALELAGVAVSGVADAGVAGSSPRIEGILPMDDEVVVAVLPLERDENGPRVPDLGAYGVMS